METEAITQGNTLLRARRTTKGLSVASLPPGMQKVKCRNKFASKDLHGSQCSGLLWKPSSLPFKTALCVSTPRIQGTTSGLARSDSSISEPEWFSFCYNLGNSRVCRFILTWSAVQISSWYISIWHIMHALWRDILQTNPTEFLQGSKHLSKTVAISMCTFKPLHMASSVPQSCPILYKPMDCSMPGSSILHCLWEIAQIYVHWIHDAT